MGFRINRTMYYIYAPNNILQKRDMKRTLLLVFTGLTIYGCNNNNLTEADTNQLSENPIYYSGYIYDYWGNGKYDSAIIYTEKLVELDPTELIEHLHTQVVAHGILENKSNASEFLNALYDVGNEDVNNIIRPAYLWNKIKSCKPNDSILLLFDELGVLRKKDFLSPAKPELYFLKAIMEIDWDIMECDIDPKLMCRSLIQELKDSLANNEIVHNRDALYKRGHIRVVLSHAYYYLSDNGNVEYFLKMAALYSPDKTDKRFIGAYFYTSYFLNSHYNNFGFQEKFLDYLVKNNKLEEGISVLSIMSIDEPITSNVKRLKALYKEVHPSGNYKQYWHNVFSINSDTFPEFTFQTLDGVSSTSRQLRGKWIFIDIWGTWCSPCVAELPDIEKFYQTSSEKYNNQLDVLSISYNSKNLNVFIDSNHYTFPVAEIEDSIVDKLVLMGFPTKLIVSPDGHYREIPWNTDWVEYIDNYTLLAEKDSNTPEE